jgi:outer membrane cobalamin receptor
VDVTRVALYVTSKEALMVTGSSSGHNISSVRKPNSFRCGKRLVVMLLAVVVTLLFGFSGQVQAQAPPSTTLEPVIVSSSRIPTSLAEAPESVTVITREQIDAEQPMSVIDVLRQIPGLHIDQPGGRGGVSSVYLRGSDPNFTVVLIDGVKVNDPTNSRGGSFDFSTLDPDHIERIEIISGPR